VQFVRLLDGRDPLRVAGPDMTGLYITLVAIGFLCGVPVGIVCAIKGWWE
jgi:hypothetical protein